MKIIVTGIKTCVSVIIANVAELSACGIMQIERMIPNVK